MYFVVPDCRRCCLCVPLRYGVLIFGYIKMVLSIFFLSLDLWREDDHPIEYTLILYRGVSMYIQIWLVYFMYAFECIFNIVLILGAHKKSIRIMRAYYYYGLATTVASILVFIVVRIHERHPFVAFDTFEFGLAITGFALQCYLLLLIRAELIKLQYLAGPFRYVNHLAEVSVHTLPNGTTRDNVTLSRENNMV